MFSLVIDRGACRKCKTCVRACPTSSLFLGLQGLLNNPSSCVVCGQCLARCPHGALSWDGRPPRPVERAAFPNPEQMESLLAARHPLWPFGGESVDRAVLDRIVRASRQLPADAAGLEVVVVTDPGRRKSLEAICLDRLETIYLRRYARPWVFSLLRKIHPSVDDTDRLRTRLALKKGSSFQGASALILLLGDRRRRRAAANAPFVMVEMMLLAETLGLAACPSETVRAVLNAGRRARAILSLPRRKRILGVLLVGRPDDGYVRAAGLPLPFRGIGGPEERNEEK